ncbi:MAG: hypothetical protein ACJAS1_005714 [Oleiphilaceae bacterium]
MANNLIISYDLNSPGQDYDQVIDKIKTVGSWANIQKSLWYVSSILTAKAAAEAIYTTMDNNDSLIVVDSTNNDAYWYGLSDEVAKHIQTHWQK